MKKQVLGRENTIKLVWNLETQLLTKVVLLDFWFVDLAQQINRFDDLFLKTGVHWVLPGKSSSGLIDNSSPTLQAAQKFANDAFETTKSTFNLAYFRYEWKNF
ncbi:MAG: hypothetical protein WKG07_17140 [Hymenobacter sp.]